MESPVDVPAQKFEASSLIFEGLVACRKDGCDHHRKNREGSSHGAPTWISVVRKALTGFSHGRPSSSKLQASNFKFYGLQRSVTTNAFVPGIKPGYIYHSVSHLPLLVPRSRNENSQRCMSRFPETLPVLQQQKNPAPNSQLVGGHNAKEHTHSSSFEEHSKSVVRLISGADMRQSLQSLFLFSGVQLPFHSRVRVRLASVIKSERRAVGRGGITTYAELLFAPSSPPPSLLLVVEPRSPPFYL